MATKVNPLNPKAVTKKRMADAGEDSSFGDDADDAAPAPAPAPRTLSKGVKPTDAEVAKSKQGLAAALKKRGLLIRVLQQFDVGLRVDVSVDREEGQRKHCAGHHRAQGQHGVEQVRVHALTVPLATQRAQVIACAPPADNLT